MKLSIEQEEKLRLLKRCKPFRIVWAKIDKDTKEVLFNAHVTKKGLNQALRQGHTVIIAE